MESCLDYNYAQNGLGKIPADHMHLHNLKDVWKSTNWENSVLSDSFQFAYRHYFLPWMPLPPYFIMFHLLRTVNQSSFEFVSCIIVIHLTVLSGKNLKSIQTMACESRADTRPLLSRQHLIKHKGKCSSVCFHLRCSPRWNSFLFFNLDIHFPLLTTVL